MSLITHCHTWLYLCQMAKQTASMRVGWCFQIKVKINGHTDFILETLITILYTKKIWPPFFGCVRALAVASLIDLHVSDYLLASCTCFTKLRSALYLNLNNSPLNYNKLIRIKLFTYYYDRMKLFILIYVGNFML